LTEKEKLKEKVKESKRYIRDELQKANQSNKPVADKILKINNDRQESKKMMFDMFN
jgi:hypothetical protein